MLIVHATKNYDPLKIAKKGIDNTVQILKGKIEVLELLPPDRNNDESYAGLPEENLAKNGPFIFEKTFVFNNRSYFNGVSDFILAGGAMRQCFTTAFISLLALKVCHFR